MDPNQLMQILQMLSQQGGGGGMGMGMGMGGTAMPQMALPQMQGPTPPATRVIPSAGLAFNPGSHSTTYQDVGRYLTQGAGPQQPSIQTGTPQQSVQGADPSTLAPGVQAGITQMQSPPPLQAAQTPDISTVLGAPPTPDQSRLGPSGGGGGIMSTLGTMGTNLYQNFLAQYGLGPRAGGQMQPATKVNAPQNLPFDPGSHSLKIGALIGAALAA